MKILEKRIYKDYQKADGFRVLTDRLWPRGIKKENAHIDLWAKEITPSNDLRKWFDTNRELYSDFEKNYLEDLKSNKHFENFLNDIRDQETITVLTSAKDLDYSHIPVLVNFIEKS